MRVVQLIVSNFMGVTAVDIVPNPDGSLVIVAGANGQGKTSTIDALWNAIDYRRASKHIAEPIRDGEDEAEVTVDLGDLIVTRRWWRTVREGIKTKLIVKAADGSTPASPQKVLDDLIGKLSFDPLGILSMTKKEQVEQLAAVVELPFNPFLLAERRAALEAERTVAGREVKQITGHLTDMPEPPSDVPDEELSLADAISARDDAAAQVRAATDRAGAIDSINSTAAAVGARIERLESELAEAKAERDGLIEQRVTLEAEQRAQPSLAELDAALEARTNQLDSIEITNANVRASKARDEVRARLVEADKAHRAIDEQIKQIDTQRRDGLAGAAWPVDGLSFDIDEGITLHGRPLTQASEAEQTMVALRVAMAANPTLRVMRIEGSRLDSKTLAALEAAAGEADMQVWTEVVAEGDDIGFVIENGSLKS